MLKRYTITYQYEWSCEVQVNEEFLILERCEADKPFTTLDGMKEMILFWSNGATRLKENGGDVLKTFLKMLAQAIMYIQAEDNLTVAGVIEKFEEMEGWYKPDGGYGFKLVDTEDVDFSIDDFKVEEII
ncbi:hypothetical protein ACVWYN_002710 [Pedobacter sp. UYP24]